MTESSSASVRQTALHSSHLALGARMVPFAGWNMPLEYGGLSAEHLAVRTRAGVFDVSHMGQIEIAGKDALTGVQLVSCNDASRLSVGQAHLSALLTPAGTIVDDLLVYRLASSHFLLVVNAANVEKDFAWIHERIAVSGDVACVNASSRYALIAVQGPAARETLQPLTGANLDDLAYYWFTYGEVAVARALISRTGYTGEDGYELFVPPQTAVTVWTALLAAGRAADVVPCGLGARDTLRLEAAMRLYGNEMDETTTPIEAGLSWVVGWDKPAFIGRDALLAQKALGPEKKLVGVEMVDPGIARRGYAVVVDGRPVGRVTSGTQTPFLKRAIGMAYVPPSLSAPHTPVTIDVRGRFARARVVSLPFYKRQR